MSVAIVGASVTGPLTALLLLRAGFEQVTIFEATTEAAPRGGGLIGLEHPALDLLDYLGIEQDEIIAGRSEIIEQIDVHQCRPRSWTRRTYPGRSTTWTLLHAALMARLPAGVLQHGARLSGLSGAGDRPVLMFENGRHECADLIVFADGRVSTGRRLLDPDRTLTYAGYIAHRGHTPNSTGTDDFLRFESLPGAQFNIATVPDGADWTFYLNASAGQFTELFGAPPDQRPFVLPHHISATARAQVDAQAHQHLPPAQAGTVETTAARMALPVMDITAPTRMAWPVAGGHAVLLGDALAPVRPHTAQGANLGFEQARGLSLALTQHRKFRADLVAALEGWQKRALPGVHAAISAGPRIGHRLGLGTR